MTDEDIARFTPYGVRNYPMFKDICALIPPEYHDRLRAFDPDVSTHDKGQLAIWSDLEKRKRGIRTSGRVHKMVRKMLPEAYVEPVGDMLREKYIKDFSGLKVFRSQESKDFAEVYRRNIADTTNPNFNEYVKPLNCSCMRYPFDGMPAHPAEAYASGDFEIVWAATGRESVVHARAVVGKNGTYGPIYTTSDAATELLQKFFKKEGINRATYAAWNGLQLKLIPHHNHYIAPYLDVEPRQMDSEGVLGSGKFYLNSTNGYSVRDGGVRCSCCGDEVDEDDLYSVSNGDVCDHCRENEYFYSEYDDEYYPNAEGSETVYIREGICETWTEAQTENHAQWCEQDGQYWISNQTVELANGDYAPEHRTFVSDGDGDTYHIEDRKEMPCGCVVSEREYEDA